MCKIVFIFVFSLAVYSGYSQRINNAANFNIPFDAALSVLPDSINLKGIDISICDASFNPSVDINTRGSVYKYKDLYVIHIHKSLSYKGKIKTFLHEIVHVWQMKQRRMTVGKYYVWFEGKIYTNKDSHNALPFEIEASKIYRDAYKRYKTKYQ